MLVGGSSEAALPQRTCRRSFKGTTCDDPAVTLPDAAARSRSSADRPFTIYADGDPIADLPATVTRREAPLRVIVPRLMLRLKLAARPRAAGRQPPPRPQRRHHRARPRAAAARARARSRGSAAGSDDGSVLVSATNGKTTTASMLAGDPRARRRRGGAQPRRLEHALGRGHRAARRRQRRAAQLGLFEVDEAWLPPVASELDPRACPAVEPVPRPARPLRRARAARRPLGRARRRARRPRARSS